MTDETDIAALMLKMRNLADRIIDAEGENNNGEVGKIIEMYDAADTTFKAENILLVLSAFEEQRQLAEELTLAAHRKMSDEIIAELDAEELKGEQVPVAWQWERATTHWDCNGKYGEWELVRGSARPKDHASRRNIQPLFTAPQKPVISKEKLCDWLEDNFDIDDSKRDAFADCFAHSCNCIVKTDDE